MPQRITKIHLLAAVVSVASLALFAAASVVVGAQSKPSDGPRYTNGTELMFPDNYREWTFLSSGLSMTYEKEGDPEETSPRLGTSSRKVESRFLYNQRKFRTGGRRL